MITKLKSVSFQGLECFFIDIEVDIGRGLPAFRIVGLPDNVISESKERIKVAVKSSGFDFPKGQVIINLAPSDVKKEGNLFDLPITLGILKKSLKIPDSSFEKVAFLGQLSLDGTLLPVHGVIMITEFLRDSGFKKVFLPNENVFEASLIEGIEIFGGENLQEIVSHLLGEKLILPALKRDIASELSSYQNSSLALDMAYIKGQEMAKRAFEIAASGGHNMLLVGSPGSGKTLLCRAFQGIMSKMTKEEVLEVTRIYSLAGLLSTKKSLILERPFRTVHHSASMAAIIGGGRLAKPGEISLANRGAILFDEFAEFPSSVLDSLRQPMEDKVITVSRVSFSLTYPAQFILLAAMNPCKCGYYGIEDSDKICSCSLLDIKKYQKKISGPILDRIDLFLSLSPVKVEELITNEKCGEPTAQIRLRVENTKEIQLSRFKNTKILFNSEMSVPEIEKFCVMTDAAKAILKQAVSSFQLSARAYHRLLKVSRTIADISKSEKILDEHILEALQYRRKEQ